MIRFENVTKFYNVKGDKKFILNNVSFEIPTGSNVGILGANGAGKSTLLRLIGGAESPNRGIITSNEDISWPLGLASGFKGSLTGRENVRFVCEINGLNRSEIKQVIDNVIEFSELKKYFEMPVSTYSSGMKARLTFGLSMCFMFDVYLVDELTSVGDMAFRAKAKASFDSLRKRASLIFVSHNLQTLKKSCESAILLRDGEAEFFPDIRDGIGVYASHIRKQKGEMAAKKILNQANIGKRRKGKRKKSNKPEPN